jgi:dTDP-4-dehydrorhamnose reductase
MRVKNLFNLNPTRESMPQTFFMVIGGDSFLGSNIAASLAKSRKQVLTTSRRKHNLSASCVYLDMSIDASGWEVPKGVETAIFCTAVTSIEQCRKYPRESKMINVDNTVALAAKLFRKGISIISPSTNLVFDGQRPNIRADEPPSPNIEYGRQKALAEHGLMNLGTDISIVRFTKILGRETPLIKQWIKDLNTKTAIYPFSDMVLAPISIDFAVRVIIAIAENKSSGIWQVSPQEDITYEQLARLLARKIGASQQYVDPISVSDSGLEFESIPKHTTLDASRLVSELGFIPPTINDFIGSLIASHYKDHV